MFIEHYSVHQKKNEHLHPPVIELEHLILPLNEQTSKIEHNSSHQLGFYLNKAAKLTYLMFDQLAKIGPMVR